MEVNESFFSFPDIFQSLQSKIRPGVPSFFEVNARLPSVGRADAPLAASENMTVVLKCYASGGENAMHAHVNEDHVFVVLQGAARFHGPHDEVRVVGALGGVMLPKGTYYRFEATGGEPLVMLRVGCVSEAGADIHARLGIDGTPMAGDSKENKQVRPVMSDRYFGL
jgi:mannose-6-phosphate isomerase-like protein (cupin superfamily)